jgi:CrcB protein
MQCLCRISFLPLELPHGDGVRHNRLQVLLITPTELKSLFVGVPPVKDFLAISVAAILGANLRYILGRLALREFGPIFPYGTLIINVVGSFMVGVFVIWTTERVLVDPRWRLLVVVGFCGSFTTFSSYAFETMSFLEQGQWGLMLANIFSNNLLCLAAALAGMAVARAL